MGLNGDGYSFGATARDLMGIAQSRVMGSASFLGWIIALIVLAIGVAGRMVVVVVAGVLALLGMVGWEVRNHRRRHRWDHLADAARARAAGEPSDRR